jgi:hypothetical protein
VKAQLSEMAVDVARFLFQQNIALTMFLPLADDRWSSLPKNVGSIAFESPKYSMEVENQWPWMTGDFSLTMQTFGHPETEDRVRHAVWPADMGSYVINFCPHVCKQEEAALLVSH